MKKNTKIAIGIGAAALTAAAIAGVAYQLYAIRRILSQAEPDEVDLDDLFDDDMEAEEAFAELTITEED